MCTRTLRTDHPPICSVCGARALAANFRIYAVRKQWTREGRKYVRTGESITVPICGGCMQELKAYTQLRFGLKYIPVAILGALGALMSFIYLGGTAAPLWLGFMGCCVGVPVEAVVNKLFNKSRMPDVPEYGEDRYVFHNKQFFEAFARLNETVPVEYSRR